MRIEHFALQVQDPGAFAEWYVKHLGFTVSRAVNNEARAYFLADESGQVMLEVYRNPAVSVPNYADQHHLTVHLAFVCPGDVTTEIGRLTKAGCTVIEVLGGGMGEDHLAMLRDPWGLAIQLCRRAEPMLP